MRHKPYPTPIYNYLHVNYHCIALFRVQNDILTTMDEKKEVFLISSELSRAFDIIAHHLLLSFLATHVGLHGSVVNLPACI